VGQREVRQGALVPRNYAALRADGAGPPLPSRAAGNAPARHRACGPADRVRNVLPMIMCFIPPFMLLGIVPAIVSAVFNAFA
jgi:hypothetical protein